MTDAELVEKLEDNINKADWEGGLVELILHSGAGVWIDTPAYESALVLTDALTRHVNMVNHLCARYGVWNV